MGVFCILSKMLLLARMLLNYMIIEINLYIIIITLLCRNKNLHSENKIAIYKLLEIIDSHKSSKVILINSYIDIKNQSRDL